MIKLVLRAASKIWTAYRTDGLLTVSHGLQLDSPAAQHIAGNVPRTYQLYKKSIWRLKYNSPLIAANTIKQSVMDDGKGNVMKTPFYGLSALRRMSYVEFCHGARERNISTKKRSESRLRDVFMGIVYNMFWFESMELKQSIAAQVNHSITTI